MCAGTPPQTGVRSPADSQRWRTKFLGFVLAKWMSMKRTGQTVPSFLPSILRSPCLLFFLWAMWLASPYLLFGEGSYCRASDNADSFLAVAEAIHVRGVSEPVGWWNPLLVGGQDALSSMQVPELVQWLFVLKPGWLAYGLLMSCQRFLAGYSLYRLLRDELALEPWAAVYGGLTYALFAQELIAGGVAEGYNVYDGIALPGIPATIWALGRIHRQPQSTRWPAAVALGGIVALGSVFPFAIFFFLTYFLWFAAVKPRKGVGFWAVFAVFTMAWLLTESLPLWASMLNAPLSQRAYWDWTRPPLGGVNRYPRMAASLARDNLLPLTLLSLGLIFSRLHDKRLNVLAALLAAILVFIASYEPIHGNLIVRLGFLSGFQFSRVYYSVPFLCATAGAIALPHILGGGEIQLAWRKRLVAIASMAVPVGLFAICVTLERSVEIQIQVLHNMLSGENYSAFYRNPQILSLTKQHRNAPPFRVATVFPTGSVMHPGMLWAYGLATVDGELQIYPKRFHRFWGEVIRGVTNTGPYFRDNFLNWGCRVYLFWPDPVAPESKPARFCDLYNLNLLSLANVQFVVSPVPLDDARLTLVDSHGEGSTNARESVADQGGRFARLRRFLKDGPQPLKLFIYENREVIPRVFVAHRTRLFEVREQLLSALADASREDLASTAFLLRGEADGIDLGRTSLVKNPARLHAIQADRLLLSVSVSQPGILVVTQNYSPFWKVRIDGTEGRLFPVDHTFQGVRLEPGQHVVELTYRPPYALH
jgi:hypothetical protein